MKVCRICLMTKPDKDINQLKIVEEENPSSNTHVKVLKFCLDIEVIQDSAVSTKLCIECFKNIIAFHKFKSLALKSDAYLKSLDVGTDVKNEVYIEGVFDIKEEQQSLYSDEDNLEVKDEPMKEVSCSGEYQSDDELLSVIKQIKNEYVDETKENAPVKKKKGRPKKVKLKRVKEEKPNQVCEECGMTVKNLKEHMYIHLPKEARKRIKCHVCDKMFSSHSARYKHNQRKHLGIKQHCKICDKFVVSIKQHTQVMHETDSLPFGCVSCGRRFISQSRLDLHMTVHTKDRPYPCDQCEKTFRSKLTMLMHKRQVHDQEKSHVCEFCSKSFFKKYHLQIHLRSHTKEKPYKCPDCDKYFSTTTILKNHRLTHSDVKMFACTLCDMTFVRPGYLNAHMISHTKVKRHPCQYCGLKFGRSDHRKRHEHTAHERNLIKT